MPDVMDVYFVNSAGRICTHSISEPVNFDQDKWRTLGNLEAPPYSDISAISAISAISCIDFQVNFFVTDVESRICTVAWKTSTGTFSDWIQVAGGLAHPGSPVTAIFRAKGKADVFVVGSDQRVYTIVYDFLDNSVEWQLIGDLQVPFGLRVTPVLHSKDEVDIFVTDLEGRVYTASPRCIKRSRFSAWGPWTHLAEGQARFGSPMEAVLSYPNNKLTAFSFGTDRELYTITWEPGKPPPTNSDLWLSISGLKISKNCSWLSLLSNLPNRVDITCLGDDSQRYITRLRHDRESYTPWELLDRPGPIRDSPFDSMAVPEGELAIHHMYSKIAEGECDREY